MVADGSKTDGEARAKAESAFWGPVALVAALAAAVYAVSLWNGFVVDDPVIVVGNPQTLSLRNAAAVFFSPDMVKPYYRPINRLSYLLDYQLFGLRAGGYHAVNVVLHAANAVLVFLLGRRFVSWTGGALFAALLFAVHPANTEAVNFISARNTLFSTLFSLAAFLALLRAREREARLSWGAGTLFLLGLLCKETAFMAAPLAAASLGLGLLPGRGGRRASLRTISLALVPFVAAAGIYAALRIYSLEGVMGGAPAESGLVARLWQNVTVLPQYLGFLMAPFWLSLFHEAVPTRGALASPAVLWAVWLAVAAATYFLVRRGGSAARFGLLWFGVNYVPISNLVPIPSDAITERFLYLPAVGLFLVAGQGVEWLRRRSGKPWALAVIALVLAVCAVLTVQRSLDWRDDLSLYRSGVRTDPDSPSALFNLGTALKDGGDLEGARNAWLRAVAVDPAHADTLSQLGTLAAAQGDLPTAEKYYAAAIRAPGGRSDPTRAVAHFNLGKIYEKEGRPDLALGQYQLFLERASDYYAEYRSEARRRIAALSSAGSGPVGPGSLTP